MKELVELLLEVTGFSPFSVVVCFPYKDLFVSTSSLHRCSSEGLTFTHVGPKDITSAERTVQHLKRTSDIYWNK